MAISIGAIVMTPVTDRDGEEGFVFGKLVDINARWAKIETKSGEIIRVGKSKIEEIEKPKTKKPAAPKYKSVWTDEDSCPHCGIELSNGLMDVGSVLEDTDAERRAYAKEFTHEYQCMGCGGYFGDKVKHSHTGRIAENYEYNECRAASGRKSCDNGDEIALNLRGKPLEHVYEIVSEIISEGTDEKPEDILKQLMIKYSHLNPGQQRMCLGNRLRGFYRSRK